MHRPRILIADDEPLLRAELRDALALLWPEAEIEEATDGVDALRLAARDAGSPFDAAFLDIRMPGPSGLEVALALGSTHVVFVTAYEEHALKAFEQGAVDYVLKPSDPLRLARTVERLRERIGNAPPDLTQLLQDMQKMQQAQQRSAPSWLQASVGSTIRFIDLEEVVYFCAEFKYTKVVCDELEAHIRIPIKELAEQLAQAQFWQIHRGYLVAAKRIASVSRDDDGALWVSLRNHDARLPVSQRYQHLFKGM